MPDIFNTIHQQLRQLLTQYFDDAELSLLCADLANDAELVPGAKDAKPQRASQIIAYFEKRGQLIQIIQWCNQQRPNIRQELQEITRQLGGLSLANISPPSPISPSTTKNSEKRIFISYKRNSILDYYLANYLQQALSLIGHNVFIDTSMRTGAAWLDQIDQQLKESDFLIVILSKDSADSEMLKAEVARAFEYRRLQNHPQTLPIRLAFEGMLPYALSAYLTPLNYTLWQNNNDDVKVLTAVLEAVGGKSYTIQQSEYDNTLNLKHTVISDDGRMIHNASKLYPPLPEFDPRLIESFETPGGTVKLKDTLYIRREADDKFQREVSKEGTTTTIRAPRQTGKSSLLIRGIHIAKAKNIKTLLFDFQTKDKSRLESPDSLLRGLAEFMVEKLRIDINIEKLWQSAIPPQEKLTTLLGDLILPMIDTPILLALDEVDRLLGLPYSQDFFGLIRSWHNNRAYEDQWNKLNLALVISTEPYLLIPDVTQSPFNIGIILNLEDFSEAQVQELNIRHGLPLKANEVKSFMEMLGGQPYLCRKALYIMTSEHITWPALQLVAETDQGPFSDHLRHHYWLLRNEPRLRDALRTIIKQNQCRDDILFFRLLQAGLVKGSGDNCQCRCGLYAAYFKSKL